jgi:hypothetical protein
MDYPDHITEYYEQKGRTIPRGLPNTVSHLLADLDTAVALMLNCGGTEEAVEKARRAVLDHPDSTWTESVLDYRTRQLHYK